MYKKFVAFVLYNGSEGHSSRMIEENEVVEMNLATAVVWHRSEKAVLHGPSVGIPKIA